MPTIGSQCEKQALNTTAPAAVEIAQRTCLPLRYNPRLNFPFYSPDNPSLCTTDSLPTAHHTQHTHALQVAYTHSKALLHFYGKRLTCHKT
jgi:hypothetical protein